MADINPQSTLRPLCLIGLYHEMFVYLANDGKALKMLHHKLIHETTLSLILIGSKNDEYRVSQKKVQCSKLITLFRMVQYNKAIF